MNNQIDYRAEAREKVLAALGSGAFHSVAAIMELTGLSERSVRRALTSLRKVGRVMYRRSAGAWGKCTP